MRFAFVLSSFVAAMAAAESSTAVGQDPAQASQAACLKECKLGDVNCQAHCIGVCSTTLLAFTPFSLFSLSLSG
jgi:hypothetical protein